MREVAQCQQQVMVIENELRQLSESMQTATKDMRANRLTGTLDLSFLAAHRRFTLALQRQGVALAQRLALAQRQLDEARTKLAEAAKERKIVEKLREKQWNRWRSEQDRKELREQDEIGMQIHRRAASEVLR